MIVVIVLLLISAGAVHALFLRDVSDARARLLGQSQTIATPFGAMEYALQGEGEPVLVIHGAGGGFDQGLDMVGPLSSYGYRLIAPSRFGYLQSAVPANPTKVMQADAYAALLDRLGIQDVAIVAISAGAWSALQFAIRHPDRCRALVLLVPADYLPAGTSIHGGTIIRAIFNSDFIAWATSKLMAILPGEMSRMMLGTDPALLHRAEPSEKARIDQLLVHLLPVSARTQRMAFDIRSATVREPYLLEKISCPVLAISAADDAFGTASRAKLIAAGVADGRSVIYPTGGHALVGHFKEAQDEIVSFFAALRKRQ